MNFLQRHKRSYISYIRKIILHPLYLNLKKTAIPETVTIDRLGPSVKGGVPSRYSSRGLTLVYDIWQPIKRFGNNRK